MDGLLPESTAPAPAYRVLARKYRPTSFDDLYGQEAMVRTLSNAFETGRIAQAYMLTGVRGVGKTTTARILARALNYEIPGSIDAPTIHMPELGIHCQAIMEGRHVDVIEMDAASHTGIGDIREITDAARYKPVSARMKVYIIDEVHMLSTAAFNGLLKTLEEPPEHVKFIFATTEIRKVPVTVLSRCQRFDLRRIESDVLVALLTRICAAEGATIDDDALRLIARAAEGSARDSLSLLDQAIAQGSGTVTAEDVRAMLGLADRARIIDLFEAVMRGDAATALGELMAQFKIGADPGVVLADLAEFTHFVTRIKIVGETAIDGTASEAEATRGRQFATGLSLRVLGRAWQILLKGLDEVRGAPKPLPAAEMVLIRLCYAADLPTPDEALKMMLSGDASAPRAGGGAPAPRGTSGGGGGQAMASAVGMARAPAAMPDGQPMALGEAQSGPRLVSSNAAPEPVAAPAPMRELHPGITLTSLEAVAALAAEKRDIKLKMGIERQMRLVRFETGRIEVALTEDAPKDLTQDLSRKLSDWTGIRWMIAVSRETGQKTIAEVRDAVRQTLVTDANADPTVSAILARFPGARIVDVRVHRGAEPEVSIALTPEGDDAGVYDTEDPGWLPDD